AKGLVLDTPEGKLTVDGKTQHVYKTARIGQINSTGLIDEVWASDAPIKPDPCLLGSGYKWAKSLSSGECS
ncbi:MAG: transporter substrate-binding protein, partial [Acidimicrobiia bacterium]